MELIHLLINQLVNIKPTKHSLVFLKNKKRKIKMMVRTEEEELENRLNEEIERRRMNESLLPSHDEEGDTLKEESRLLDLILSSPLSLPNS